MFLKSKLYRVQTQSKISLPSVRPEPVQVFKIHVSDRGSIKAEMVENPLAWDLCFAVQRTNRIISRQVNEALRSTGLTAEQIFLLAAIGEAGSPRISEVSLLLGLDHSTVVSNLKPLVRKNWVTMFVDVDDRRARRLLLTDNGSARLVVAFERLQELEDALVKKVGGTQNALSLCRLLGELSTACA
ncbi:MarR family transcriptional regulator [Agrobacterium tumefaciens]|nr:MarR family transcriptional regulator [Agrobacterium tumefaciens]OVE89369.1 hypothetical protein B7W89_15315 [Agrobacterium tumefaciens]